jgi:Protein of unknown function (DUF3631)
LARRRRRARPRSTVLFDEIDTVFSAKSEQDELRGLLNVGYRRGGRAWRIETKGKEHTPRAFEVFGPKLLAGIGNLPATIADRSIPIELERKRRDAQVARFRRKSVAEIAEPLRQALETWAPLAVEGLAQAQPDLPDELNDRAQEMWEPLIAIADEAGGVWPARALVASVELHQREEDVSTGVLLLAHIREAFEEYGTETGVIASEQLVEALTKNEHGPWGRWWRVDTESAARSAKSGLARRLKPFGIRSTTVRVGTSTPRGYRRGDFVPVWERYLPVSRNGATSATDTTAQVGLTSDVADVSSVAQFLGAE